MTTINQNNIFYHMEYNIYPKKLIKKLQKTVMSIRLFMVWKGYQIQCFLKKCKHTTKV